MDEKDVIIGQLRALVEYQARQIHQLSHRIAELQAKITAAGVAIANIEGALDSFEVDCGRYPTTEEGLGALINQPTNLQSWHGEYLKRGLPKDPWGNPFVYRQPGQHNTKSYDLCSFGPNGQEGGGDDIDNWSER